MENWLQNYDPLGNAFLSTIVAALPVVVLLSAIAVFRIRIHFSALLGLSIHTIGDYVKAVYRAYGVNSRGELLARVSGRLSRPRR